MEGIVFWKIALCKHKKGNKKNGLLSGVELGNSGRKSGALSPQLQLPAQVIGSFLPQELARNY
jgi:hypothetical protein